MGLPYPRLALEEQAPDDGRERFSEMGRAGDGAFKGLVVGGEVRQRAVLIPLGDARFGEALATEVLTPAVAADNAPRTIGGAVGRCFPAGVITERTGHRWNPSVQVTSYLHRTPHLLLRAGLNLPAALAR